MSQIMELDKLIKTAEQQGVKFGKSDPYNRLRYYTKMGWMPNMIRKKTPDSIIKTHYPTWALERLILIEKLKAQGLSNTEIDTRLKRDTQVRELKKHLTSPETRSKVISYSSFVILILILVFQFRQKPLTVQTILSPETPQSSQSSKILDTNQATVLEKSSSVWVYTPNIKSNSIIQVTFLSDYSPATRYWVSEKIQDQGFKIELNNPTEFPAVFYWTVIEP